MLAVAGACVLGIALIWNPWARVSLESATVVLPVTAAAAAPAGKGDVLAIVYSGDGGWADLDQQLGRAFAAHGIPVLGVSTLKYYWRERSPEESAQELDALMTKYLQQWDKRRVWLVGFSFGADVLPTVIDQLSPANRARITQLVLLSPSKDLGFRIEIEGYMHEGWLKTHLQNILQAMRPAHHYPALPPLLALQGRPPVACYYGLEEADDSLCVGTALPHWVRVYPKHGDHHFDGGYQPLAKQMLDELPTSQSALTVTH